MSKQPLNERIFYYLGGITIFSFLLLVFGFYNHPLPFVDLIAYSYLNGIDTDDLATTASFYVTQLSYILVHFIFRILTIWGIDPIASSTAVFSLQSFGITISFLMLIRACGISWFIACLLSLFLISCYMGLGLVVWGGPLYFSFGVVLSLLSFCFFIEENPSKPKIIAGALFAIAGVISHPFSLPILSILFFSIFIFSNKKKNVYIAFSYAICVFFVITSVNEFTQYYGTKHDLLSGLISFDLSFRKVTERIYQFLIFQSNTAEMLLGTKLITAVFLGYITPLIIFFAFLISLLWSIALLKRKVIFNNTSKSLTAAVLLLFTYSLIAPDAPFGISMWPQRLLLAIFPLSFALVVIFFRCQNVKTFKSKYTLVGFSALLFLVPTAQIYQLSKISIDFQSEVNQLEEIILNTGLKNSFFFFDRFDITPFWKRSVPFSLLVSERIKKNNLYFISEWHGHPQHNIRTTASINKLPTFSIPIQRKCDGVNCEWIIPSPRFISRSMKISINDDALSNTWHPLWVAGKEGAATLLSMNLGPFYNSFRLDHWGHEEIVLTPGALCSGQNLQVDVVFDIFRKNISINCNGVVAKVIYPAVTLLLSQTDRLGINNVTSVLGGVTPLTKNFPGVIIENLINKVNQLN